MSDATRSAADVFAAAKERKRALAEQIGTRPVEVVIGVVAEGSKCGWPEESYHWTVHFSLHCWKIPPGPLKRQPLSVKLTGSRKEFDSIWERVNSYEVIRIRARVVEDSIIGTPQSQLVEFVGPDSSDPELNQAALDYQQPVIFRDRQFGQFTLDRQVNWYTTKTKWKRKTVTLNLALDNSGEITARLETARLLLKDQNAWDRRIKDYAAEELLALKNENWLGEDEPELHSQQFKKLMTLESVTVQAEGAFEFWYDDGNLFWGHSIQVCASLSEGPTSATIQG